jgi:hypothetical protein
MDDVECPDCGVVHDPRRCARTDASCSCCASMFESSDERAAWIEAQDAG